MMFDLVPISFGCKEEETNNQNNNTGEVILFVLQGRN